MYICDSSHLVRDAVDKCPACSAFDNCGYCLSTLQCVEGTEVGPLDRSPCPQWIFAAQSCPSIIVMNYFLFSSCSSL